MSINVENEIKFDSEPCVLTWDENLYVGCEDGCIKSFDAKLSPKESWHAHGVQPFAIATGSGVLYSSSNDGGIKVWSRTGQKIAELSSTGADVGALQVFDTHLYAGDEDGNIIVYENNVMKAQYNVLEEVKSLWFSKPYLFTVRDQYVTVTEIKPDNSRTRFMTRHSIEGRAPLGITDTRLVFMSRNGNNMCLHDASIDTVFKKLDEVKVSDMIITTLATNASNIWTGGWDGFVRKWKIIGDKLHAVGEIYLGGCINSLTAADDRVYVAVAGGKVIHLK